MADIAKRTNNPSNPLSRSLNGEGVRERSRHKPRRTRNLSEKENVRAGILIASNNSARANGHLHRSLKTGYCLSDSHLTYTMDVATQPPKHIRPGIALPDSLVVWLRSITSNGRVTDMSEVGRLFAVATLTSGNNWSSGAPIGTGVLSGQKLVDSVHPVPRESTIRDIDSSRGRAIGYFSFPNLIIRQKGVYRIRVTLIRVGAIVGDCGAPLQGGLNIQTADTSLILVD